MEYSVQPQHIDAVETLLNAPLFPDEERSEALYDAIENLDPIEVKERTPIYVAGLRLIAKKRHQERQKYLQEHSTMNIAFWNDEWNIQNLTIRGLRTIAAAETEAISAINNQLEDLNYPEYDQLDADATVNERPTPLQESYIIDTLLALTKPAKKICRFDPTAQQDKEYDVQGVLNIGPTGIGKTVIMAETARRLKISQSRRMLIVAPSIQLVEQLCGKTGDKTFTRFAKDITVSPYYHTAKNLEGDIIITTIDQFVAGFCEGQFFGTPIHLLAFDEVHHLTEPRVESTFLKQWHGPTLGFTATPDYEANIKDTRCILPYTIEHITLMESIEAGYTNGAQIFTIYVDCEDLKTEDLAPAVRRLLFRKRRDKAIIEFLEPLLEEGRRAMVFCDQGKRASEAIQMADTINEVVLPSGNQVRAEAIHTYNPRSGPQTNTNIIQRFEQRSIDVLTTVETGVQGLNADIDVITMNSIYSYLKMRQLIGRGTRKSNVFPVTIYAQFLIPRVYSGQYSFEIPYTVYQCFGLEQIEQGKVITSKNAGRASRNRTVNATIFSPQLQKYLKQVNAKTIGEVLFGTGLSSSIPDDFVCFDDIPRPSNSSASTARARLDTAGYTWLGRYELKRRGMIRYYEPAAKTYFTENPLPPRAPEDYSSLASLARTYDVGIRTMYEIAARRKVPVTTFITPTNQHEAAHIHNRDIKRIEDFLQKEMPLKQPGDIAIVDLAKETGTTPAFLHLLGKGKGIRSKYRRDPTSTGKAKNRQMLSKEQADIIRDHIAAFPNAEKGDKNKMYLVEKLGLSGASRLNHHLTDAELEQLTAKWMVLGGRKQLTKVWSAEQAKAIEERLRKDLNHTLPPHLILLNATNKLFTVRSSGILKWRKDELKEGLQEIKIGFDKDTKYTCIPWGLLEYLESIYKQKRLPGAIVLDYHKLPHGPEDTDPGRIAYAREVQAQLLPKKLLVFENKNMFSDGIDHESNS